MGPLVSKVFHRSVMKSRALQYKMTSKGGNHAAVHDLTDFMYSLSHSTYWKSKVDRQGLKPPQKIQQVTEMIFCAFYFVCTRQDVSWVVQHFFQNVLTAFASNRILSDKSVSYIKPLSWLCHSPFCCPVVSILVGDKQKTRVVQIFMFFVFVNHISELVCNFIAVFKVRENTFYEQYLTFQSNSCLCL